MKDIIIVLDPGHGSDEYKGCEYGQYIEKDVDLAVASVIQDYLNKFEGVKVYMTRSSDVNVGLKERYDIAKNLNADYFISVHFNASAQHDLYGSEVWLPAQLNYYTKMYPIANELIAGFEAMGYFDRGIKTRLNSAGTDNYYAVIKGATNYGIPSCIIEHCHLDNLNDTFILGAPGTTKYMDSLTAFGIQDGLSIAKALNLKSTELGLDFTNYKAQKINTNNITGKAKTNKDINSYLKANYNSKLKMITPDKSAPEINTISVIGTDTVNSTLTVRINAKDKNSYITYYKYSLDGGNTYSPLFPWPRSNWYTSADSNDVVIPVPNNDINLIVTVYNSFDVSKDSNMISLASLAVNEISDNKSVMGYEDAYFDEVTISTVKLNNEVLTGSLEVKNNVKRIDLSNGVGLLDIVLTMSALGLVLFKCIKRIILK